MSAEPLHLEIPLSKVSKITWSWGGLEILTSDKNYAFKTNVLYNAAGLDYTGATLPFWANFFRYKALEKLMSDAHTIAPAKQIR